VVGGRGSGEGCPRMEEGATVYTFYVLVKCINEIHIERNEERKKERKGMKVKCNIFCKKYNRIRKV